MDVSDLLVVGGGPGGLALAVRFGSGACIVEREAEIGGLCRTVEIDGGVFDIGGHSFHSPHPDVRDYVEHLMAGRWHCHQRDARVYHQGLLIPYPFQRYFHLIPDHILVEQCRRGLEASENHGDPENYEIWIRQRFGDGVAEHFMIPYNRKLFARDLRRIACDWVGQRVAAASGKKDDLAPANDRRPLQPDTLVGYPSEGGFVEIFRAMASKVDRIELNQEIVEIDCEARSASSRTGKRWHWRLLASTMPVCRLTHAIKGFPAELRERAAKLERVALRIVLILVADPLPEAPHRVYIADPEVPAHKVAFNHTSSDSLRSRPVHAIMCEVSYSDEKPLPDHGDLERRLTDWLLDSRLVRRRDDIIRIDHLDVPWGYPVHTHDRKAIVDEIRSYLEPLGIFTFGRFGGWQYVNSDECIRQGFDLADRLSAARAARG